MKLLIFGSRTLSGDSVKNIIKATVNKIGADIIATAGEPKGVCKEAREYAAREKIELHLFYANNKKYAAGKYERRSIDALRYCDAVLFIHDGSSKGTENEIKEAEKMKIERVFYVKVDEKHKSGFFDFSDI